MMVDCRRYLCTTLSLLPLLLVFGNAESAAKECITIVQKLELEDLARDANVLVAIFGDTDNASDDDEYKELCQRFESTPVERVKHLVIGRISKEELAATLLESAKPSWWSWINAVVATKSLPVDRSKRPQYILFKQHAGSLPEGRLYIGDTTADNISDFLSSALNMKRIGSFVYSLGHLDFIAANLVRARKSDHHPWKQKAWAYSAKLFATMASFFATTHNQEVADIYVKTCFAILTRGLAYPENQVERLERLLQDSTNHVSALQQETLRQKIYTLKKFIDPVEVSDRDIRNFFLNVALNVGLLLAVLILIPVILFPSRGEDDDEEDEPVSEENVITSKKDD